MTSKERSSQIVVAIVASLLLHLFVIPLLFWVEHSRPLRQAKAEKKIHIHAVSRTKEVDDLLKKQLVSIEKPQMEERPKEADYSSEWDQKVERETRSSKVSSKPHPAPASEQRTASNPPVEPQREFKKVQGIGQRTSVPKVNLMPSWQELAQYSGSAFNDHLEDVEEDAQTRLNTFEWKHASFFNRMKESISEQWSPDREVRIHDPEGILLGRKDRYTLVEVFIDPKGNLVDVNIKKSSGVFYLDDEAVRALKAAAPFPSPPHMIFKEKSTFSFSFGFYVGLEKGYALDFNWRS